MIAWPYLVWVALLLLATSGGASQDLKDGKPLRAALGAASGAVCVVAVLAFAGATFLAPLGRALVPLSVGAGAVILHEAITDLRALDQDPELDEEDRQWVGLLAGLLVIALFAPAVVLGVHAGLRAWR